MKKNYLFLLVGIFLFPTILISQTFTLAGTVERHNGDPVEGVEVAWGNTSILTDVSGNYALSNVPINDPIGLSANGTYDKFEDITVLDLLIIRQHILYINLLSYPDVLQADYNNSGSISAIDMVQLARTVLHIDNTVDSNYQFCFGNVSSNCVQTNPSITASPDTIIIFDIVALKKGDVAISSDYMPAPPEAPSPILGITETDFLDGEDVQIDVRVEDFNNIAAIQQTFEWDPNLLVFESISGFNDLQPVINEEQIGQGILPVYSMINSLDPMNLPDGEALYTLNFKANEDALSSGQHLFLSDQLTRPQVVWQEPNSLELFVLDGEYISIENPVATNDILSLESFEIFPNPMREKLNVNVLLENAEVFDLNINNVLGKQVFSKNFHQKELKLEIDLEKIPSGVYFLSVQTEDGIRTESFLKK